MAADEGRRARLERVLRAVQWLPLGHDSGRECPLCHCLEFFGQHDPDCPIAGALADNEAGR